MADFGDDEFRGMICVEAAQTSKKISLAKGEKYSARHAMIVMD
jgi:D-hexose-6-phosphate mutarotase